ncbi:calcium/sodium antiporter, partial [Pectobacterium brasiliense]|nr:calcium/sodium antiporter [Pectobacterium brasiliense]
VTLLCGVLLHDRYLSRTDGIMLLFAAILCLVLILRMAQQAHREGGYSLTREQLAELPQDDSSQMVEVLSLILCMIILPMAAR